jgi:hypothetical protein
MARTQRDLPKFAFTELFFSKQIISRTIDFSFADSEFLPISKQFFFVSFFSKKKKKSGSNRAARWFIFKPKIPIWANFGGS